MLITPLKRFKILFLKKEPRGEKIQREEQNGGKKRGEWSVRCYKHGSGPGSVSYRTNGREQMIKLAGSHHHSRCREDATVSQPRLSEPPKNSFTRDTALASLRVTSTWTEVQLKHKHGFTYGEIASVVCAQGEQPPSVHWHHAL